MLYQVDEGTIIVVETGVIYHRLSNGQVWVKTQPDTESNYGEPVTTPGDPANFWEFLKMSCVNSTSS